MFSSEASLRTPDSSQLAGPTATLTRKQQKGFLTLTDFNDARPQGSRVCIFSNDVRRAV